MMKEKFIPKELIINWIQYYLIENLDLEMEEINIHDSFQMLGLDSASAVGLVGDIEYFFEFEELPGNLLFEYNSIQKVADYLSTKALTT